MVAHNRLFIDGDFGASGQERWSVGIGYVGPGGIGVTDPNFLQAWAINAADYLEAASIADLRSMLSTAARITRVRTYGYGISGDAVASGAEPLTTPVIGTGTPNRPPQCAAVFTLQTGLAGRSRRGRIYWPWMGGSMDGSTLKSSVPLNAITQMATLLNALGAEAPDPTPMDPVVVSQSLNQVTPVTSVRVGDVVDTQRRRRDSLVETYYTASV